MSPGTKQADNIRGDLPRGKKRPEHPVLENGFQTLRAKTRRYLKTEPSHLLSGVNEWSFKGELDEDKKINSKMG
jgi:hypothetical protein